MLCVCKAQEGGREGPLGVRVPPASALGKGKRTGQPERETQGWGERDGETALVRTQRQAGVRGERSAAQRTL